VLALAVVAAAAAATKSKSKTVTVAKGKTRTVIVAYPDALKDPNATYKRGARGHQGRQEEGQDLQGLGRGRIGLPGQDHEQVVGVGDRQGDLEDERARAAGLEP
jgi:hypothetical protein